MKFIKPFTGQASLIKTKSNQENCPVNPPRSNRQQEVAESAGHSRPSIVSAYVEGNTN